MEAGEVTMQMQEYIYLGTTPMYFLGASGRIVGSGRIESPHLRPHLAALLFHLSRADIQPFSLPLPFYAILSLSLSLNRRVYAQNATPDRYSGDLRAN